MKKCCEGEFFTTLFLLCLWRRMLFQYGPQLADDDSGEHQGAAGELGGGKGFVQDEVAPQGAEDGFEAHDDGGFAGGGVFLAHYLQGEGHAGGEDACIGNGYPGIQDGGEGDFFCGQGGYEAACEAEDGLGEGELQRIHMGSEAVDEEDLGRPAQGAESHQHVPEVQDQAVLDGQEVQAADGQQGPQPVHGVDFAQPEEGSSQRHQHDVEGGDEGGLAHAGELQGYLLEGAGCKEKYP